MLPDFIFWNASAIFSTIIGDLPDIGYEHSDRLVPNLVDAFELVEYLINRRRLMRNIVDNF
jgi:hypothetical protein